MGYAIPKLWHSFDMLVKTMSSAVWRENHHVSLRVSVSKDMVYTFKHPRILSGKLLHNYGKSPFLMVKSTINHHFQVHIRFATLAITPENGWESQVTAHISTVEMSSGFTT